jgi:DNA-binding protein H-NS
MGMTPDNKTESSQGLTLAELQERLAKTNQAIADRRIEELKVIADGYAKKLVLNGFSIREGMDALMPYLRTKH